MPPEPPQWTTAQAHTLANVLSLSPFLFQALATMRDTGLLAAVLASRRRGLDLEEAAEVSGLSPYGVQILVDMGRSVGLFRPSDDGRLLGTPFAHFLINHRGIDVQFGLSQKFAWGGLSDMTEALRTRSPEGLKSFGDWTTLYPHLSELPDDAREAWFDWDHHYSDSAFAGALEIVLAGEPRVLLDIGGNTGRFARQYLARHPQGSVVLQDLPQQLEVADRELAPGHAGRYLLHACDVLDPGQPFFSGADCAWMSQFVCCFSEEQLVPLLRRTAAALPPGAPIYVLDTFWDRQTEPSAEFSLHAASLYFAVFASGDGKMYAASDLLRWGEEAGLQVTGDHAIGAYHTLLVFQAG